jgi:hypothetical protein
MASFNPNTPEIPRYPAVRRSNQARQVLSKLSWLAFVGPELVVFAQEATFADFKDISFHIHGNFVLMRAPPTRSMVNAFAHGSAGEDPMSVSTMRSVTQQLFADKAASHR